MHFVHKSGTQGELEDKIQQMSTEKRPYAERSSDVRKDLSSLTVNQSPTLRTATVLILLVDPLIGRTQPLADAVALQSQEICQRVVALKGEWST